MKKIIIPILLFLTIQKLHAQPVTTGSSSSVTVKNEREIIGRNFSVPRFLDTTAANADKGVDTSGALIYTYSDKKIWVREHSPKKWVISSPDLSGYVTLNTTQSIPGLKTFTNLNSSGTVYINDSINYYTISIPLTIRAVAPSGEYNQYNVNTATPIMGTGSNIYNLKLPDKSGTFALLSDISTSDYPDSITGIDPSIPITTSKLVEKIVIIEPTSISVNIGTTLGGNDIATGIPVTSGIAVFTFNYFANSGVTLYFSGTTSNSIIKIYKR